MPGAERTKFTIGQGMVGLGLFALAMATVASPRSAGTASIILGFAGSIVLVVVVTITLVDTSLGVRCPNCGSREMVRTTVTSFRDRFFRCPACGVRLRRGFLTGWDDASSPEFDVYYGKARSENPWTAPPGVDDDDLTYSKTHVNLVVNKRRRRPNPPDQGRTPGRT